MLPAMRREAVTLSAGSMLRYDGGLQAVALELRPGRPLEAGLPEGWREKPLAFHRLLHAAQLRDNTFLSTV